MTPRPEATPPPDPVPGGLPAPRTRSAVAAGQVVIRTADRLDDATVAAVRSLVDACTDADGVAPLSEHVLLHLAHGTDVGSQSLLACLVDPAAAGTATDPADGGGDVPHGLVGYAHLDTTDTVAGASAELAVHPAHRGRGTGAALVAALLARTGDQLRLWAHGEQASARALAARHGFVRSRVLWQMRRSLHAPLPRPEFPADVTVRTFVPGQDEPRWVAVNARSFAAHPDQGSWTEQDLKMREAEPWFDPAGFFLAERGGALVGFHWTKVHGGLVHAGGAGTHVHEPLGEVYVVGVDPAAQGSGLGPALTLLGLRHLRGLGLASAMLYVDEANTNAIRVYERLGFTRWDSDVTFTRGAPVLR